MHVALQGTVDVVVTDYQMPGVTGEGLVYAIRQDSRLRDMPIIVMTGSAPAEAEALCRKLSLAALLQKPFDTKTLVSALLAATGEKEPEQN